MHISVDSTESIISHGTPIRKQKLRNIILEFDTYMKFCNAIVVYKFVTIIEREHNKSQYYIKNITMGTSQAKKLVL